MISEEKLTKLLLSMLDHPIRPTTIDRQDEQKGYIIFPRPERETTTYYISEVIIGGPRDIASFELEYYGDGTIIREAIIHDLEETSKFFNVELLTSKEQSILHKIAQTEEPVRYLPTEDGDFITLQRGGGIDRILFYKRDGKILDVATMITFTSNSKIDRMVVRDWTLLRKLVGMFVPQENDSS